MEWWQILLICLGLFVILIICVLVIIASKLYNSFFKRKRVMTLEDTDFVKTHPDVLKRDQIVRARTFEDLYAESFDHLKLHGYYFKAPAVTKKTVISVHGWYGNALSDSVLINDFLINKYNFLNIDLRAHGQSEGQYLGFSILDYRDLLIWVEKLIERDKDTELIIYGGSMGAATVMLASDKVDTHVKAMICDCGFTQAYSELKFALKNMMNLPTWPLLPLVNFFSKRRGHYSFKSLDALDSLKNAKAPMLFIHGEKDNFVDPKFSRLAYQACGSKIKEYKTFPNATHAASYLNNPDEYQRLVTDFLEKNC